MAASSAAGHALGLACGRDRQVPLTSNVLAELQYLLLRRGREEVHGPGDDPRPPRLMARAKPGSVVAVEVFVEQHEVPPVWVLLKLPRPSVYRPPPALVLQEDAGQPVRNLFGHFVQRQALPG